MTVTLIDPHGLPPLVVPLQHGGTVTVEVHAEIGPFVIHQRVAGGMLVEGWTASHRTTGMRLWSTQLFAEAVRAAQWMDAQGVVPVEAEACKQWRDRIKAADYTRWCAELQKIAPRYGILPGVPA